jgi:general secretion pathway protein M
MTLYPLPEGRRGAALALGVLAIALGLVWGGIVAPLAGWYHARALALSQQRALAAHMAAIAATLPSMRAAEERARRGPAVGALLSGDSDAIAAAALQGTVEAMARATGASLTSVTILPGEQAGAWRRIGLRLEAQASFSVIVSLLEAVLRGSPPMLVDDLSLSSLALEAPGPLTITADFTIYAFRRGGSPALTPDERQALAQ